VGEVGHDVVELCGERIWLVGVPGKMGSSELDRIVRRGRGMSGWRGWDDAG
jgi:hypothetical protein